jgi:hypothetical protein
MKEEKDYNLDSDKLHESEDKDSGSIGQEAVDNGNKEANLEEQEENNTEEREEGTIAEEEIKPESEESSKKKDHTFIYAIVIIFIILLFIIFLPRFVPPKSAIVDLDELHQQNLQGKLSKDKGYIHNGLYSFVYYDNLWNTQLQTANATRVFDMKFHYRPIDVEDIDIVGELNRSALARYKNFFMTFNPLDEDMNYIGVAIGETDFIMIQVFGKGVISACTHNESDACTDRPIVECNSTSAPVFYFASEEETNVLYLNNCIILSGKREDILRATDRMLFDLLGIM